MRRTCLCARDLLDDPLATELPTTTQMMARAIICCPRYFPSPLDVASKLAWYYHVFCLPLCLVSGRPGGGRCLNYK